MSTTNGHLIHLDAINKVYDSGRVRVRALDDVSLEVARGEFITIVDTSIGNCDEFQVNHGGTDVTLEVVTP